MEDKVIGISWMYVISHFAYFLEILKQPKEIFDGKQNQGSIHQYFTQLCVTINIGIIAMKFEQTMLLIHSIEG